MPWEILFNDAFSKLEKLARGEAQDDERVPEGAFTFRDLRSIVADVRKMGVERKAAERSLLRAEEMLVAIANVLSQRDDQGV
jgi:hypothetical protein